MKKAIIFICTILLIAILVIINIKQIGKVEYKYKENITTSLKENKEESQSVINLNINGINELITIKTYNTHLGYQIDYMSDYFDANMINNSILKIVSKEDNNSYLEIELLNKDKYEDMYKEYSNNIDYNNSYIFMKGNDKYIKITKNTNDSNINKKITYMINTLYFN